ncbi:Cysteine/O-acetylserine efflux protein [Tepidimonas alkaliphilus]|uniref:Cysteine/O-acetylserine efflux protein n=1 Tax=Tepidimonas alkaliphilus TaxID=2588942 RepID=A0A554W4A1_9BURK|nr:LysE family translocator [Tepidimonas alkaliphilus]TSE18401.1 Cysteine/O-acetylserine efflux protein [Tepidimonas alkaliphilus]
MSLDEWIALWSLALAATFTPGPNTTLSTALGAQGGLRHALPFVSAVPVGWVLLLGLCSAGVGAAVLEAPALRGVMVWGGAGYLLWLAWQIGRSASLPGSTSDKLTISFGRGVMLQFLNPKAWMLVLAIVAGWIGGMPQAGARFAQALPVVVGCTLGSNLLYAWVGSRLQPWLEGPIIEGQPSGRRLRRFNAVMGLALAISALWMLLRAQPAAPMG